MTCDQLQYSGPHPLPALVERVIPKLETDGVMAREADIVVGSSAQQLIMLAVQVVSTLSGNSKLTIGVEEPGYPTIFDSFERLGHQLVGIEIDAHGAIPASLENALNSRSASGAANSPSTQSDRGLMVAGANVGTLEFNRGSSRGRGLRGRPFRRNLHYPSRLALFRPTDRRSRHLHPFLFQIHWPGF